MGLSSKRSLERWAERVFDLPGAAPDDAIRAAILGRLRCGGGNLDAETAAAVALLRGRAGDPVTLFRESSAASERKLQEDLTTFATAFFTLSCDERRQRFESLAERADLYPWLAPRLTRLEAALELPFTKQPDENDRLADMVCDLALRSGPERTALERELLAEVEAEPIPASEIARWKARHPQLVAFEGAFLDTVLQLGEPRTTRTEPRMPRWALHYGGRRPQLQPSAPQPTHPSQQPWSTGGVPVFLIIGVVSALVRCAAHSGSSSLPPPGPQVNFPAVQHPPGEVPASQKRSSRTDLDNQFKFERGPDGVLRMVPLKKPATEDPQRDPRDPSAIFDNLIKKRDR